MVKRPIYCSRRGGDSPQRRHCNRLQNRINWPKNASMPVDHQAHNLKVVGSNPTPATDNSKGLAISS